MRSHARETEREEKRLNPVPFDEPSRMSQVVSSLPVLIVVTMWGWITALLYMTSSNSGSGDALFAMLAVPLAMAVVGSIWADRKSQFSSGITAAIMTGTIVGFLFLIAATIS